MRSTWLFVLVALLVPSIAFACPVCGTGPERSREAYVSMTLLLSLLPLGMVGGLVYFFVRHARQKATPELDRPNALPSHDAART